MGSCPQSCELNKEVEDVPLEEQEIYDGIEDNRDDDVIMGSCHRSCVLTVLHCQGVPNKEQVEDNRGEDDVTRGSYHRCQFEINEANDVTLKERKSYDYDVGNNHDDGFTVTWAEMIDGLQEGSEKAASHTFPFTELNTLEKLDIPNEYYEMRQSEDYTSSLDSWGSFLPSTKEAFLWSVEEDK